VVVVVGITAEGEVSVERASLDPPPQREDVRVHQGIANKGHLYTKARRAARDLVNQGALIRVPGDDDGPAVLDADACHCLVDRGELHAALDVVDVARSASAALLKNGLHIGLEGRHLVTRGWS